MKKHYMLFTLLFTLLPFLNSYAEENKALSIPQASTNNVNGYRLQIPETILGDRSGGDTDRTGKSFTISAWVKMDRFMNSGSNNKGNVIMGHGAQAHTNYNGSLILATTETGTLKIISGASNTVTSTLNTAVALNEWTLPHPRL